MTIIDAMDEVLDLENQCYDAGFEDGQVAGARDGFIEGKELGIQTGFQRYLSLGVLQGRHDVWQEAGVTEKVHKQVESLRQHIGKPKLDNDPQTVEAVDFSIKMAKNKAKLIAASTSSPQVRIPDNKIAFARRDDAIEDLG